MLGDLPIHSSCTLLLAKQDLGKYHSIGYFSVLLVPKDAGGYLRGFPGTLGSGVAKQDGYQYPHHADHMPWVDEKN